MESKNSMKIIAKMEATIASIALLLVKKILNVIALIGSSELTMLPSFLGSLSGAFELFTLAGSTKIQVNRPRAIIPPNV